jgi:hypothetical protein
MDRLDFEFFIDIASIKRNFADARVDDLTEH